MQIRMLDAATIGRIAAGEVVARPVSVVKELVENSLDAGANSITVEIRNGGIDYIRVSDNGSGIPPQEIRMAFENHATSKITSDCDLNNIETLGFRGEALPSIAAVAKVSMQTRKKNMDHGMTIVVHGGRVLDFSESAAKEGTTVIVEDLFYNLPVRRSFLKRGSYEAGLVTETVTKMMLGNAKIAFRMINNGKTTYQSFDGGSMIDVALHVYGRDVAQKLIEIDAAEGGMSIRGFVGLGDCARSNRSQQSFFINGRLVDCQLMSSALESSCKGLHIIGTYPMCALHMTLPPNIVDVNVHPNKREVRFRDEVIIRQNIEALFERALVPEGMLNLSRIVEQPKEIVKKPQITINLPPKHTIVENERTEVVNKQTIVHDKPTEVSARDDDIARKIEHLKKVVPAFNGSEPMMLQENTNVAERLRRWNNDDGDAANVEQTVIAHEPDSPPVGEQPSGLKPPEYKLIGTAFNAYVFVEVADNVLIIDQHAAHERLLYERFMKELDRELIVQQLLTPLVLNVTRAEYDLLMDNSELMYEIGYEIDSFGESAVQVRSVPQLLGRADTNNMIMAMVGELSNLKTETLEQRRQRIIMLSCKKAVKAGDKLNDAEISQLLIDMQNSDAPPTCPHGRPINKKLTQREIERFFKRV